MYLEGVAHPWKGELTQRSHADFPVRLHPAADLVEQRFQLANTKAAPSPSALPYTVEKGDNLSRIVRDHLQSLGEKPSNQAVYDGVRKVAQENGLKNPDVIHPGQRLDLRVLGGVPAETLAKPLSPPPAPREQAPPAAKSKDLPMEAKAMATPSAEAENTPKPLPTTFRESRFAALPPQAEPVSLRPQGEGGPVDRPGLLQESRIRFAAPENANGPKDLGRLLHEILEAPAPTAEASQSRHSMSNPWSTLLGDDARLSSDYGMRPDPFTGKPSFHEGIDLAAPRGTAIHPFQPGVVQFSGWQGGYGRVVIVDHQNGLSSVYAHNAKNHVNIGDRVTPRDVLGEIGSTGRSTGPHLHFEVRKNGTPVNPVPVLQGEIPIRSARR